MEGLTLGNLEAALVELGFTKYEALAYMTLVQMSPMSGYELAKVSGVPQAKVYEVLSRLVAKGAAVQIAQEPALYVPTDPLELTNRLQEGYTDLCTTLRDGLSRLKEKGGIEYVWNILDYDSMMAKAKELCQQSEKSLAILCWDDEFGQISSEVHRARERGVKVLIVGHQIKEHANCLMVCHEVLPHVLAERGRQLVMVSDAKLMLLGSLSPHVAGVWSKNPGLISLAREFIAHEAYLWQIIGRFHNLIYEEYGGELEGMQVW